MTSQRARIVASGGLTVADVMHADCAAFSATATVAEVRDWFAQSASRRLALVAGDAGYYMGSLTPADLDGAGDPDESAVDVASYEPTVRPDETARAGREQVLQAQVRRVAVVDDEGRLVGVLAVTTDARAFSCR